MTVWALFLRQQSGYGGFENEILKKMTAAAGTSAAVIFLVDRPKNHLLGRWVPRSALALDEKTSDATMMRVSIRIKKQRR